MVKPMPTRMRESDVPPDVRLYEYLAAHALSIPARLRSPTVTAPVAALGAVRLRASYKRIRHMMRGFFCSQGPAPDADGSHYSSFCSAISASVMSALTLYD